MAAGRRGHPSGGRWTLLTLLCRVYLLLTTQPSTRAQQPSQTTRHVMTRLTSQVPGNETVPDEDTFTGSFNISRQLQWALDICPTNTCKLRCGSNTSHEDCIHQTCNCDMRCRLFDDCCPDFEEICPAEATKPFTEAYIKMHSDRISHMTQASEENIVQSIWWVGKCPEQEEDSVTIEFCERPGRFSAANYLQYIPVVYDGFIFKNKYCAMCNGVLHSYSTIRFSMVCDDYEVHTRFATAILFNDFDRALDTAGQHCNIKYNLPDFPSETIRYLSLSNGISTMSCPSLQTVQKADREVAHMCELYQSLIVIGKDFEVFNNPHCALCNGISLYITSTSNCGSNTCVNHAEGGINSLEILVDIAAEESKRVNLVSMGAAKGCSYGHIHDDIKGKCVAITCQLGFVATGTGCFRAYEDVPQIFDRSVEVYTIVLLYSGYPSLGLLDLLDRVQTLPDLSKLIFLDYDGKCTSLPPKAFSFMPELLKESAKYECYIIEVALWAQLSFDPSTLGRIHAILEDGDQTSKMFVFNYDTSDNLNCREGRETYSDDAVLFTLLSEQHVFVRNVGYTWSRVQVPVMIFQDRDNLSNQDGASQVLVKLCIKDWGHTNNHSLNEEIKGILTLTGNVVSLAALLLSLISFVAVPHCKGIIRILLINLIVALFISQLTFLLANVLETRTLICQVVAIFQHYSWLAYFFLMNATALEMAWRFRSLQGMVLSRRKTSNRGRIACLLLYGWMGPLLLVIPSVVLDITNNLDLSPRYGMEKGCWLNNQSALLYFFVIPFSIIVCFNTLLILFTIIRIKISASQSHMLSQERSVYQINIRLSTLMGLSWLLGLVASYTNLEAIWYAFIVLNTLQGVILFSSFSFPQYMQKLRASRTSSSPDRSSPVAYKTQNKVTTAVERF